MTRKSAVRENQAAKARAVVLLSGGLDSYTTAAAAQARGYACYALTVNYGQRHGREVDCARKVAAKLGVREHRIIEVKMGLFGNSALTGQVAVPKRDIQEIPEGIARSRLQSRPPGEEIPKEITEGLPGATNGRAPEIKNGSAEMLEEMPEEIPVTYVPARNTILLSLALGWAETLGAFDIFIGVNAVDYSGYPDCREEFVRAFEELANVATAAAVQGRGRFAIHAPLINMSKAEIIRKGHELGCDYGLTHSCYDPDEQGRACGRCDSCRLRLRGFAEAQIADPIEYMTKPEDTM